MNPFTHRQHNRRLRSDAVFRCFRLVLLCTTQLQNLLIDFRRTFASKGSNAMAPYTTRVVSTIP